MINDFFQEIIKEVIVLTITGITIPTFKKMISLLKKSHTFTVGLTS
jgi:hypothetical protein